MASQVPRLHGHTVRDEIATRAASDALPKAGPPTLAVILIGLRSDSQMYVKQKVKACAEVGIRSTGHCLPADAKEEQVLALIDLLNNDDTVHGILLQLPLPDTCSAKVDSLITRIHPNMDVDGLHPANLGRLSLSTPHLTPYSVHASCNYGAS